MKRLVICYDGTWNAVTKPDEVTNVVRMAQAVKSVASDDVEQVVYYNAGVGSGGPLDQFLGGVFGVGLRNNVKRGLAFLSLNWDPQEPGNPVADEIYIFGFSRGAYSARALAGVIGAIGGIPKQSSFDELEEIWNHYRKSEEEKERDKEEDAKKIASWIYPMAVDRKPIIKCLGVWDTVGSYGIPAGLGLGALARKLTSWTRGFHDNEIGDEIEYGLQAMAIDEARRSFPATAWVTRKAEDRRGVEQVLTETGSVRVVATAAAPSGLLDALGSGDAADLDLIVLDLYHDGDEPCLDAVARLSAGARVLVMSVSGAVSDMNLRPLNRGRRSCRASNLICRPFVGWKSERRPSGGVSLGGSMLGFSDPATGALARHRLFA